MRIPVFKISYSEDNLRQGTRSSVGGNLFQILNHENPPSSLFTLHVPPLSLSGVVCEDDSSAPSEETATDSKLGFSNGVHPKSSVNDHPERVRVVRGARRRRNRLNLLQTSFRRSCLQIRRGKASVVKQRLSYLTETVLTNEITRNRIVLSFNDSLRKPLRRRPSETDCVFPC